MKKFFNNQAGQTAVEYILMIVVMAGIVTTLVKRFNEHFLGDEGECNDPQNQSLVCQVQLRLGVTRGNFERLTLPGAPK